MKVGFVCPDDHSIMVMTKGFLTRLVDIPGHRVYAICPDVYGFGDDIRALGAEFVPVHMERFVSPGHDLKYIAELYGIFKRYRFDSIINWTTKPNIFGTIAAKLAGVPRVSCAIRGLGRAFLPQGTLRGSVIQKSAHGFYRIACHLSDRVWFTNRMDMELFVKMNIVDPRKTLLTVNAIDLNDYSEKAIDFRKVGELREQFGLEYGDRVVVMVARMIWSKGIREFVESARILGSKYKDLKFILVGPWEDGELDRVPMSYLEEANREPNFRWVGLQRNVKEIYFLSTLAVLPSYYMEGGYPRALLEPMAFGRPVITTDLPQCRAPVMHGYNGYLVHEKDSNALAAAIETIIVNPERLRSFGLNSRKRIELDFDNSRVIDTVLSELI